MPNAEGGRMMESIGMGKDISWITLSVNRVPLSCTSSIFFHRGRAFLLTTKQATTRRRSSSFRIKTTMDPTWMTMLTMVCSFSPI